MAEWLEFYDPLERTIVAPSETEESDAPERPEAYDVLMQLRRFDLPWAQGGYEDQPWILMQELNAVIEAEDEHAHLHQVNQQRRAEYAANKASQPGTAAPTRPY